MDWWSANCSGSEEKGENASGGLGSSLGSSLAASHSKGGTAAKSSQLRRSFSGLAAEYGFRLFRSRLGQDPKCLPLFPLFPQPALLGLTTLPLWASHGVLRQIHVDMKKPGTLSCSRLPSY